MGHSSAHLIIGELFKKLFRKKRFGKGKMCECDGGGRTLEEI